MSCCAARRGSRAGPAPRAARSPAPRRWRCAGSAAGRSNREVGRCGAARRAAATRRPRGRARPRSSWSPPSQATSSSWRSRFQSLARTSSAGVKASGATRREHLLQQSSAAEGAGPVVDDLLRRRSVRSTRRDLFREHVQHGRDAGFRRCTSAGASSRDSRGSCGNRRRRCSSGPFVEGANLDAADAERRQHVADVVAQRRREDDEQGPLGVDARVVVGEVGDAVQGDRRLARAGGAADRRRSRRTGRVIRRELLRIDQPGDVGQVLVGAPPAARARSVPRRRCFPAAAW